MRLCIFIKFYLKQIIGENYAMVGVGVIGVPRICFTAGYLVSCRFFVPWKSCFKK